MLNTFVSTLRNLEDCGTSGMQRLQLGLLGYLIRFAPLAFIPHRQSRPGKMPSPSVVLQGLKHFTAPPGIPLTSPGPKLSSLPCTQSR